jgi:7,8-dihydropterin-6-yl-methyl-4-(beta-D-ribofuranosyl)aminobenzene 5'-phosphate synthase
MFNERAVRLKTGAVIPVANVSSPAELARRGATVVNDPDERVLLDGHSYYSGEIPRVSAFEKGRVDHLCRTGPDAPWQPDPFLMDERMLVAHVRQLGLIVLSPCSHAGIVNVCMNTQNLLPDIPIYCVTGGLHLGGNGSDHSRHTGRAAAIPRQAYYYRVLYRLVRPACAGQRIRRRRKPVVGRHDLDLRR